MRTLTRYAIGEFLKTFILTVSGMTLFMFVVVGAREAVRHGLGPGPILRIMPYVIPESMRFSIPAAALLAACTVYGRMSADNEVIAVKSLGISAFALMKPAFGLAFVISLGAVWISDVARSWGIPGQERMVVESIEQIVYGMLNTGRSYSNDHFFLTVKRVEGRKLVMPTLTVFGDSPSDRYTISARFAELQRDPENNALKILLTDSTIDGAPGMDAGLPNVFERSIPLSTDKSEDDRSPSDYALRGLNSAVTRQGGTIQKMEEKLAAEAAYQMLTGDIAGMVDRQWEDHNRRLQSAQYRLNRLRIEPWRRWANGFSCFFFVVVGVPVAIQRKNSDFVSNFFRCFLPILVVYYPLLIYGVDRAKDGALPLQAVWLGNLVMLLWGTWLIRRVLKH